MSVPAWRSRGNRAALALATALGMAHSTAARGGRRPGSGRRARVFLGKALGDWNRHAIVDAMMHAMTAQPFGREPFAQLPGDSRPSIVLAAMMVELMLRDHASYRKLVEAIVADGRTKRAALIRLRRTASDSIKRTAPGHTPSWRTCLTYYKRHRAKGGAPDHNHDVRGAKLTA